MRKFAFLFFFLTICTQVKAQPLSNKPELIPGLYRLETPQNEERAYQVEGYDHKITSYKKTFEPLITDGNGIKYAIISNTLINDNKYELAFLPCSSLVQGRTHDALLSIKGQATNLSVIENSCIYINPKTIVDLNDNSFSLIVDREKQQLVSHFKLVQRMPGLQILYRNKEITVFSKWGKMHLLQGKLALGQVFASSQTSRNWLKIHYLKQNKLLSGWVNIDNLIEGKWIAQQNKTDRFSFEVSMAVGDEAHKTADAIKIIDSNSGKIHQILYNIGADGNFYTSPETYLKIVDANFDGHSDIMIQAADGGAGPNSSYSFYLFNPQKDKFEFHEGLSSLIQTEIDPKSKTIISSWRDGAAHHGGETYTFISGIFTKLQEWDDNALGPRASSITTFENDKGTRTTTIETEKTKLEFNDDNGLSVLINALNNEKDPDIRAYAAKELGSKLSEPKLKALIDRYKAEKNTDVLETISYALTSPMSPVLTKLFFSFADEKENHKIFNLMITVLDQIADHQTDLDKNEGLVQNQDLMISLLKHSKPEIRQTLVKILGKIKSDKGIEALQQHFKEEKDIYIKSAIVSFVATVKNTKSINFVIQALADPDSSISTLARYELRNIHYACKNIDDPAFFKALSSAIETDNENIKISIIYLLEEVKDIKTVPLVIKMIEDKNQNVRFSSLRTLARLKDPQAVPSLIKALKDNSADIRLYAMHALAEIQGQKAKEQLSQMLEDKDKSVRKDAEYLMKKLTPNGVDRPIQFGKKFPYSQ